MAAGNVHDGFIQCEHVSTPAIWRDLPSTADVSKPFLVSRCNSDPLSVHAGHLQDHFNQQSYEDKCSGTVQVLIDMELLAHTDYFVGSYNSRWPRVVQYLRYILYSKERDTSVDASAYGLDMFSNIKRIFQQDKQPL